MEFGVFDHLDATTIRSTAYYERGSADRALDSQALRLSPGRASRNALGMAPSPSVFPGAVASAPNGCSWPPWSPLCSAALSSAAADRGNLMLDQMSGCRLEIGFGGRGARDRARLFRTGGQERAGESMLEGLESSSQCHD